VQAAGMLPLLSEENLPIKNTKTKMHQVLYDYLDNQAKSTLQRFHTSNKRWAFSKTLTKEQVDDLNKLHTSEFLRYLNLSVTNTKLKMRQVLHDFLDQKPGGYKVVMQRNKRVVV
jgi:hypothetical protein